MSESVSTEPEGFRLPLRTSLTRPILMGGVPRTFAIGNATLCAAIGMGLQLPWIGLPLWLVLQGAAAWASARDPWFIDAWPRHLRRPLFFEV